jgi:hypothetical protein
MGCPIVSRSGQNRKVQLANFGVDFREEFCFDIPRAVLFDFSSRGAYNLSRRLPAIEHRRSD